MPTLFLSRKEVRGLLDMPSIIRAVEQTFRDFSEGKARMPPKAYVLLDKGDFRAMPAAIPGAAGVKWVSVYPQNPPLGLPTIIATLIYNDPLTGYPLAVMDATDITAYRTGATSAIAAKYLARKKAHTLGLVGAGRQAYTQLLAHAELFELKEIKVFDISKPALEKFVNFFSRYPVKASSLEETVASDIVCTVTTARAPILKKKWVVPGTHINAIGADAEGKEELEPAILKDALVVVDDLKQASTAGEINVPLSKGLYRLDEVYGTIDEIVAGEKPGRRNEKETTIFDSTGVAIEDIAVAKLVYEKAKTTGGYLSLDFFSEA